MIAIQDLQVTHDCSSTELQNINGGWGWAGSWSGTVTWSGSGWSRPYYGVGTYTVNYGYSSHGYYSNPRGYAYSGGGTVSYSGSGTSHSGHSH